MARERGEIDSVLTVAEAAVIARRSVRTIRRAYRSGRLSAFRDGNGRSVHIRYGDLCEWLMAGSASAAPPSLGIDRPYGQVRHRKRADERSRASENLRLLKAARQRRS
jgi:excisionase family DNA binding protein